MISGFFYDVFISSAIWVKRADRVGFIWLYSLLGSHKAYSDKRTTEVLTRFERSLRDVWNVGWFGDEQPSSY